MKKKSKKHPYKSGDWVRIKKDIRDSYRETWHEAGDVLQVKELTSDGEGLMFSSDLGIHYLDVRKAHKDEIPISIRKTPITLTDGLLEACKIICSECKKENEPYRHGETGRNWFHKKKKSGSILCDAYQIREYLFNGENK